MPRNKKQDKLTDFMTNPETTGTVKSPWRPKVPQFSPRMMMMGLAALAIIAIGAAGYFYFQLNKANKDPNANAKEELQEVIAQVGKHVVLPTDEQPTLATVTDPAKLQDQPFFAKAKTGYKVLIYSNAKKAILYDPEEDKVVEVAPINLGDESLQSQSQEQPKEPTNTNQDKSKVVIQVVNSARVSGLAARVADKLRAAGYTDIKTVDGAVQESNTTISYQSQYEDLANEINGMFNNQAKTLPGASEGIFITLGTNFQL